MGLNSVLAKSLAKAIKVAVEIEREKCAKIAEGRGIFHRVNKSVKAGNEAFTIARAIRDRSIYPDHKEVQFTKA